MVLGRNSGSRQRHSDSIAERRGGRSGRNSAIYGGKGTDLSDNRTSAGGFLERIEPHKSSKAIIPKLKISAAGDRALAPPASSGAMYIGVPAISPAGVSDELDLREQVDDEWKGAREPSNPTSADRFRRSRGREMSDDRPNDRRSNVRAVR